MSYVFIYANVPDNDNENLNTWQHFNKEQLKHYNVANLNTIFCTAYSLNVWTISKSDTRLKNVSLKVIAGI